MRILVLGGGGMLGHRLWIELSREHEVWATVRSSGDQVPALRGVDRSRLLEEVDVTNADQLTRVIGDVRPELVINCVGLVKQRSAANDSLLAIEVNALFPHRLANVCLAAGSRVIHVSTDCVFSGRAGAYTESSFADAEDLYGRSKLLGEIAYPHAITLRTSIIGRELTTRQGLTEWFLAQQRRVKGYTRSRFSGVTTHEFARVVSEYVIPRWDLSGLYHLSSSSITKYELLELLAAAYRHDVEIEPEDQTVCDRTLDSTRFKQATGFVPRTWPEMVHEMAADSMLYAARGEGLAMLSFHGKRILVTGGTGSLGRTLVRRLLSGEMGKPSKIIVFSRDETKQHEMRLDYLERRVATDDAIYQNSKELLSFRIGDVRDYESVTRVVRDVDVIFNAAALKQVPTCEYFPLEAVRTNVVGAGNIVRAIRESGAPVEVVVGISTDKACKPINVMGMTKALQERVFVEANLGSPRTRFVCVRYGNVIASRGSVVPLFLDQIARGGPVTVTLPEMTRFLLTLDNAVDTVLAAVRSALPGETYIPIVPSARVVDIAQALIGGGNIQIVFTGIRPGEKIHEILVSEEECYRTVQRDGHYVIRPLLPELRATPLGQGVLTSEYSSGTEPMTVDRLRDILGQRQFAVA